MNENVTESGHAQFDLCKIRKTIRMIEQSANNKGNHRFLLEMFFRECHARL